MEAINFYENKTNSDRADWLRSAYNNDINKRYVKVHIDCKRLHRPCDKGVVSSPSRRAVSSLENKPRKYGQTLLSASHAASVTGAVTSMWLIEHKQFLPCDESRRIHDLWMVLSTSQMQAAAVLSYGFRIFHFLSQIKCPGAHKALGMRKRTLQRSRVGWERSKTALPGGETAVSGKGTSWNQLVKVTPKVQSSCQWDLDKEILGFRGLERDKQEKIRTSL